MRSYGDLRKTYANGARRILLAHLCHCYDKRHRIAIQGVSAGYQHAVCGTNADVSFPLVLIWDLSLMLAPLCPSAQEAASTRQKCSNAHQRPKLLWKTNSAEQPAQILPSCTCQRLSFVSCFNAFVYAKHLHDIIQIICRKKGKSRCDCCTGESVDLEIQNGSLQPRPEPCMSGSKSLAMAGRCACMTDS